MPLTPGYGETLVDDDDESSLTPLARELLGGTVAKAAIYDLEQGIQEQLTEERFEATLAGETRLDELLTDHYLRDLHRALYRDIWMWAGQFRIRELNIGIPPEQIAVSVRSSMDSIAFRWSKSADWTPRELGIAVHAECVRIHPFVDGNGRSTRLLADLVFLAAQEGDTPLRYDWNVDKTRYIELLRQYDQHRQPEELATFINVVALGQ